LPILISAVTFGIVLLLAPSCLASQEPPCHNGSGKAEFLSHHSGLLVFRAGMTIDADGSPHAYSPVPGAGLDALHNAGSPGHWDGILTDDGEPVVQGPDDPAPGYYISQTALEDESQSSRSQRRFVNSEEIPYISLPRCISGPRLGDVAIVVNSHNGRWSPAILADEGPTTGEGSIALAKALDVNADPLHGGIDGGIVYIVFKKSGIGSAMGTDDMLKIVQDKLADPDIQDSVSDAVGSILDVSAMLEPGGGDVQASDTAEPAE
jgi:hypothetical protein